MRKVADDEEAAVPVPVVVGPVQVELPVAVVLVEVRHVAVAVRIEPRGASFMQGAVRATGR